MDLIGDSLHRVLALVIALDQQEDDEGHYQADDAEHGRNQGQINHCYPHTNKKTGFRPQAPGVSARFRGAYSNGMPELLLALCQQIS